MTVDPDDARAIRLDWAMRDLRAACELLADPNMGHWAWFDMVTAVLLHGQSPGRPLEWILVACARRTIHDIHRSL